MLNRKEVFSVDEAATVLRMSRASVRELIRKQLLTARDLGGHYQISRVALIDACLACGRPLGQLDKNR